MHPLTLMISTFPLTSTRSSAPSMELDAVSCMPVLSPVTGSSPASHHRLRRACSNAANRHGSFSSLPTRLRGMVQAEPPRVCAKSCRVWQLREHSLVLVAARPGHLHVLPDGMNWLQRVLAPECRGQENNRRKTTCIEHSSAYNAHHFRSEDVL